MDKIALFTVATPCWNSNHANMIARLPVTCKIQIQCIQLIREGFPHLIASKMVLVHKDVQISTLEDIQKLKAKDLRDFVFKFGNDGRNKSGLGVKSLHNTHAKHITTGRKSTAKCR